MFTSQPPRGDGTQISKFSASQWIQRSNEIEYTRSKKQFPQVLITDLQPTGDVRLEGGFTCAVPIIFTVRHTGLRRTALSARSQIAG